MEAWLTWARGPAFRFALLFCILAVLRLLLVNAAGLWLAARRGGARDGSLGRVARATARWFVPVGKVPARRSLFALVSMSFHVAVIVTPLFLAAHIALWRRGAGVGWPALPQAVADYLTLLGVGAALVLLAERIFRRAERALSRPQDYVLPLLILATFASGYLAVHPGVMPLYYDAVMLVHVVSGNLALVFLPFSKLSHALLFPFVQLASDVGWRLVPGSGQRVAAALGKESEPI